MSLKRSFADAVRWAREEPMHRLFKPATWINSDKRWDYFTFSEDDELMEYDAISRKADQTAFLSGMVDGEWHICTQDDIEDELDEIHDSNRDLWLRITEQG